MLQLNTEDGHESPFFLTLEPQGDAMIFSIGRAEEGAFVTAHLSADEFRIVRRRICLAYETENQEVGIGYEIDYRRYKLFIPIDGVRTKLTIPRTDFDRYVRSLVG